MREQEYKAREKSVRKMSRDGLIEESLSSGERVKISKRQADEFCLDGRVEEPTDFGRKPKEQRLKSRKPARDAAGDTTRDRRHGKERSQRTENIRGHPARAAKDVEASKEAKPTKKETQEQGRSKKEGDGPIHARQGKTRGRLSFSDEKSHMVRGRGTHRMVTPAAMAAISASARKDNHGADEDNAAVEAMERMERMTETALRHAASKSKRQEQYRRSHSAKRMAKREGSERTSRLRFDTEHTAEAAAHEQVAPGTKREKRRAFNRFWQKRRYRKLRQSVKLENQTAGASAARTFSEKTRRFTLNVIKVRNGTIAIIIALILLLVSLTAGISSCGTVISGGASVVIGTTYISTDEDIYAVEAAYSRMEAALNGQVGSVESRHPGYDEYRYQVDEISHNPYHLISYFTALYGGFTYEQVKKEIEEIFHEQYGISTDATRKLVKEKRTMRVGQSLGKVVTSGYCNCVVCCGKWAGGATASGAYPVANHTIAVDAANPFVPIGTKIVMNGVEYVVEDTGNFARYGAQFDVYYADHGSASAHGHQTWDAYIADGNGSQEVEVTTVKMVNRLDVALKNHSLDAVLRARMDENEEKRYDAYNATYGNRDYLFDTDALPSYGNDGFRYEVPPEALSDEKFAKMIREAEKYLGYPYVWGGSSPSTSFDCSGFVSWVVNHCGNGWNFGRQTAESFRSSICAYVAPRDAKPGDLIFFQGTYNTSGASHIGIYVGNNMMIHCGNPVQYAKINTSYWKQHFLAFGRLP